MRCAVKEIRVAGRNTQGVRIKKLKGEEKVVSVIKIDDNIHNEEHSYLPGTFDPITYGHIDVIKKSLKIFDRVVVAAAENINKDYLFSVDERVQNIKDSLFKDLKLNKNKILVISFNTLTINLFKKYKANVIIRGLRVVSDFEY